MQQKSYIPPLIFENSYALFKYIIREEDDKK